VKSCNKSEGLGEHGSHGKRPQTMNYGQRDPLSLMDCKNSRKDQITFQMDPPCLINEEQMSDIESKDVKD